MNNTYQMRRINSPRLSRTAIIRVVADTRVPHDVEMRYVWDGRHRGGTVTEGIGTAR